MTSFNVGRYKKLSSIRKSEKDRATIATNSRSNVDAPNDKTAEEVTWSGVGKSQSSGARILQLDARRPAALIDLDLKAMNANYAVVRIGGKTRVVSFDEVKHIADRWFRYSPQSRIFAPFTTG